MIFSKGLSLLLLIFLCVGCYEVTKKEYREAFTNPKKMNDSQPATIATDMELGHLHSIFDIITRNKFFESFAKDLKATNSLQSLHDLKKVTLFVPLDDSYRTDEFSESKSSNKCITNTWYSKYIVPKLLTLIDLKALLARGNGSLTLKALDGTEIIVTRNKHHMTIEIGAIPYIIELSDQNAVNGVIHGIQHQTSIN